MDYYYTQIWTNAPRLPIEIWHWENLKGQRSLKFLRGFLRQGVALDQRLLLLITGSFFPDPSGFLLDPANYAGWGLLWCSSCVYVEGGGRDSCWAYQWSQCVQLVMASLYSFKYWLLTTYFSKFTLPTHVVIFQHMSSNLADSSNACSGPQYIL